jgi:hypothetical protein
MGEHARYANEAHKIRVTDGHEAEARAAQLRKRPNRVGLLVLRVLGFRSDVVPPPAQERHLGPAHEHSVHQERPAHTPAED